MTTHHREFHYPQHRYAVFGVKEIHRLKNKQETTGQIVGRYNVRLLVERRGTDGVRAGNSTKL